MNNKCPFCTSSCGNSWCSYAGGKMTDKTDTMDPQVKQFLEEDCQGGDYIMMTLMVNKQLMKEFLEYLQNFEGRAGLFQNGTTKAAVLGKNKRAKLGLVKDDEEK